MNLTDTKDFALDKEHCLFKHGNPKDLAKKIEWFIDHPNELARMKEEYLKDSEKYTLDKQVDALEQMFYDAVKGFKEGKDLHTLYPRKKDKRLLKRVYRNAKKQKKHPERYK